MVSPFRIFITGIPTAGKSHLGRMLAAATEGVHVSIDKMRDAPSQTAEFYKWTNFYLDQDEYSYYSRNDYDVEWQNLVRQSEGIWPGILAQMHAYDDEPRPVIFEGVNILPHLARRDLSMPGIAIVGRSYEDVVERLALEARWGRTQELQAMEADAFWNGERPRYIAEAEKYGYTVYETADEAFGKVMDLFKQTSIP